jgi:hypothetical protein
MRRLPRDAASPGIIVALGAAYPSVGNGGASIRARPVVPGFPDGYSDGARNHGATPALHGFRREKALEGAAVRVPWWLMRCALAGMLFATLTLSGGRRLFICFQF